MTPLPPAAPKPVVWAAAVAVEEDRLLLVRRGSPPDAGLWAVPTVEVGGDEALVAAVVRAVEETAGLEAVCGSLLGHIEQLGDDHRVLLVFEAVVLPGKRPAPAASWVTLDDVTARPLVEGLAELLADRGILRLIV